MNNLQAIPLIFGVTGHRDLREQDIPKLKKSVRSLLKEFKQNYPNTPIVVISALAEGADMLVARVAKELGIALHVLLPYQQEEYLNSFNDRELNEKEFLELKEYANRFEINSCIHTFGAENCYQQLGEKIANDSNILIALWDGIDNGKSGGTSAIVKYQRAGFKENRFDALDGNAIFIITTPRKSNPNVKTDFSVKKECLSEKLKDIEFEAMLKR
jgi:CheY-like chemotaxis protein